MEKIWGASIILNGKPVDASEYNSEASAAVYYEVIRVIDGKFLFLDDHLERLRNSCEKGGNNCPNKDLIAPQIQLLVNHSKMNNGNVKLLVYQQDDVFQIACFFIPHFYPSVEDYFKGVKTMTFEFVRPDPTIKRWNALFRLNVSEFIQQENIYEAILVNEKEELTEGSRSNLFFIDHEDRILTAPETTILPGITRKYVLQICKENNIHLTENLISLQEAEKMKSCFITGTSPKVLPVKMLNGIKFEVGGEIMKKLIGEYEKMINAQLRD